MNTVNMLREYTLGALIIHTHEKVVTMSGDLFISVITVLISLCLCISNHHAVQLKSVQFYLINSNNRKERGISLL